MYRRSCFRSDYKLWAAKRANSADKIERLRILSFEDASRSVKRKFKKAVKAFNWREYSEVIKEKTKYSETRIMTQGTDDIIRRLVICTTDEDDSAL
uniref:DUF4252 domain-containing protein n=1 Tax=Prevotella aurantiaca TaxID=596085 RepID=UPI001F2A6FB9|nr:DUF4252 domain-containing protein [Prevotella aurantiaca]